jgi:hypothetical protein
MPDQEVPGRTFTETWLVLEYCDKGNLQDAVDRGVFNLPRTHEDQTAAKCNARAVRCVLGCGGCGVGVCVYGC